MRTRLCRQCKSGVGHGDTLTFDPGCRGCQEKLATGKRTGKEPIPTQYGKQTKLSKEQYSQNIARFKKAATNRRKYYEGLVARNIVK